MNLPTLKEKMINKKVKKRLKWLSLQEMTSWSLMFKREKHEH